MVSIIHALFIVWKTKNVGYSVSFALFIYQLFCMSLSNTMIFLNFQIFFYIESKFVVHETDCSVKCGNGTKTVTVVHCSENQNREVKCEPIPEKKQIPCYTQIECPIEYTYSQWGSWTQCSRYNIYTIHAPL